ncbi:MAG TPA: DUF2894 domain-containing protein [Pararobbsia sp.]|nr:DUF2894 domain-containing protein [Pararobbsia sp.]
MNDRVNRPASDNLSHLIDALARRAAGYTGSARQVLDRRLAAHIERHEMDRARGKVDDESPKHDQSGQRPNEGMPPDSAQSALAGLIAYMAEHRRPEPVAAASRVPSPGFDRADVEVLDYVRDVWEKVSSESQWRQFSTQVPGNAGPLNTEKLMVRALSLMRDVSPDYVRQFLSYVNALSWMERIAGDTLPARKEPPRTPAPRVPAPRKGGRAKTR